MRLNRNVNVLIAITIIVTILCPLEFNIYSVAAPSFSGTSGYTTVGENGNCFGAAALEGCKFTSPSDCGTITQVSAYIAAKSGTVNAEAFIYSGVSGPTDLVASSSQVTGISTVPSWVNFAFAGYVASPNTVYWLCIFGSDDFVFYWASGSNSQFNYAEAFAYSNAPSNWAYSCGYIFESSQQSIYATYSSGLVPPSSSPTPTTALSSSSSSTIGIYSDPTCTNSLSSLEWGTLAVGGTKTLTVYVRNQGTQDVTLSKSITDWNPITLSNYLTLNWDYTNQTISPLATLVVTLSLIVASNAPSINYFSFNTTITATSN